MISIAVKIGFSNPIRKLTNHNPTMQFLGLAFLILIDFMLIKERAHLSHNEFFENSVIAILKGYLYFAIAFSLFVVFLTLKLKISVI